jgi:hypothetical protein
LALVLAGLAPGFAQGQNKADKEKEWFSNEDADFYEMPETDDVATLKSFIQRVREYEPTSRSENTLHERRGPRALAPAIERLKQIAKPDSADWFFANALILQQEVGNLNKPTPGELADLFERVRKHVQQSPRGPQDYLLAQSLALRLEQTEFKDLAVKAYRELGELVG